MTAAELWMQFTAHGHEVSMTDCEHLAGYQNDIWVSTQRGAYIDDMSAVLSNPYAQTYLPAFWLTRNGQLQEVEPALLQAGLAAMRRRGELA